MATDVSYSSFQELSNQLNQLQIHWYSGEKSREEYACKLSRVEESAIQVAAKTIGGNLSNQEFAFCSNLCDKMNNCFGRPNEEPLVICLHEYTALNKQVTTEAVKAAKMRAEFFTSKGAQQCAQISVEHRSLGSTESKIQSLMRETLGSTESKIQSLMRETLRCLWRTGNNEICDQYSKFLAHRQKVHTLYHNFSRLLNRVTALKNSFSSEALQKDELDILDKEGIEQRKQAEQVKIDAERIASKAFWKRAYLYASCAIGVPVGTVLAWTLLKKPLASLKVQVASLTAERIEHGAIQGLVGLAAINILGGVYGWYKKKPSNQEGDILIRPMQQVPEQDPASPANNPANNKEQDKNPPMGQLQQGQLEGIAEAGNVIPPYPKLHKRFSLHHDGTQGEPDDIKE